MFNVRIEIDEIQFRNFVTYTFFHMLIDKPNWNACNWRVIETTSITGREMFQIKVGWFRGERNLTRLIFP